MIRDWLIAPFSEYSLHVKKFAHNSVVYTGKKTLIDMYIIITKATNICWNFTGCQALYIHYVIWFWQQPCKVATNLIPVSYMRHKHDNLSKIKVPASSIPGEGTPLVLQLATIFLFPHTMFPPCVYAERERDISGIFPSDKDIRSYGIRAPLL